MILELSNSVTPPAELGLFVQLSPNPAIQAEKPACISPRILVSTIYSGIFIQVAGHKSQISDINLGHTTYDLLP
jgi:hypothetical protein